MDERSISVIEDVILLIVNSVNNDGMRIDKGMEYDTERTAYLEQYGVRVLRIPNNEVNQKFSVVCEYIDLAVKQSLHR